MDFVPKDTRSRWKSLDSIAAFGWCGSAAIGGILLSGGVGKHINCKHIFSERVNGNMEFKRGFNRIVMIMIFYNLI